MRKKILCLLCVLCLVLLLPMNAIADFGDFSGSSDFGSGWDSGSSWDSGSGWDSSSSWDDDDDYSSSVGYVGGYDDDDGGGFGFIGLVIILIIIYIVIKAIFGKKKGKGSVAPGAQRTEIAKLRPIEEYQTLDENFDPAALSEKISNLYVQMQNCWTDKDIEPVRPYFTDTLWSQMDRQVVMGRARGRTNCVGRIAVLGVTLRGFFQVGEEDHMIVELRTRIVDYTLNDKTGELISGDRTKEKFMTYEWEMTRPSGTITSAESGMNTVNCPNCGAPISLNQSAKCPYCDSVITLHQHDWAISAIKGISQVTGN